MERVQQRFTFAPAKRGRGNPNMVKGRPSVNTFGRRSKRVVAAEYESMQPARPADQLTIDIVREALQRLPECCAATGFTYLIASDDVVKIGKSESVEYRLSCLQSQNSARLELVALARGSDLEQRLHRRFKRYRVHGEWFSRDVLFMLRASLLRYWSRRLCFGCALASNSVDVVSQFVSSIAR